MLLALQMNMLLETAAIIGTEIANANAVDGFSNYEICQRSGFRQYPTWDRSSRMRVEWNGAGVRAESLDPRHPQEFVQSRSVERHTGPQSPEGDNSFISTSIAPEDL